ncbi:MAG: hypothetical protein WBW48_00700 [Anaerolineae bacterium]
MIRKLGLVLIIILILATGVAVAATPEERAPVPGTPTPAEETEVPSPVKVTPTPTPTVSIYTQPCPGSDDFRAMEEFRAELLTTADVLDALYPYAQAAAQAKGKEPAPRVNRKLIEAATHQELCWVRVAFGEDYTLFKDMIKVVRSQGLTSAQTSGPLNSFTIIPTPTPVTTPTPGIRHTGQDQTNDQLGDLPEPDYPTSVGCPKERYSPWALFATLIIKTAADVAEDPLDDLACEGSFIVIALPFGGGTSLPGCIAWGIAKTILLVAEAVDDGLKFCNDWINDAELGATYDNIKIIHAELAMADWNLTTRANWTDHFLFEFRNLNLRSRIEANLASPEDDPVVLFELPGDVCITTDLEAYDANNPADRFSSKRIAGCGLLEVVSDTVRSAIDMTRIAGGPESINNAEAEFDAAVGHYNNGEWKLAYARFRKAYREAVRP